MARLLLLVAVAGVVGGVVGLPFSWWQTFRIEERFGFNRMTLALWLADLAKGVAVGAVLGLPLRVAGAVADAHRGPAVVAVGMGRVDGASRCWCWCSTRR